MSTRAVSTWPGFRERGTQSRMRQRKKSVNTYQCSDGEPRENILGAPKSPQKDISTPFDPGASPNLVNTA